jgi:DNA polymerase III epsilon subunit-like protein
MRDVLHVAIDVDTHQGYEEISPEPEYHIGLSILDTRNLLSKLQLEHVVEPYQFTIGKSRYCRRERRRFLFGESEEIQIDNFAAKFNSLVGDRKYILVLHGANCDSKFLETFGIISKAAYLVDTNKPAQYILKLYYRYSLEKLLENLGIAFRDLHAAGNDAHFVLKAYVQLVIKDAEMFSGTSETTLIQFLRPITCTPIPPRKPESPPAPKKLGVYAKRRLNQARKEAKRVEKMAAAERAAIEMTKGEAD